jgi:exopolyphosphatase/guanosine-5'-triphosphate,3'-diphosphate pyrophosphatase
MAPERIAAIDIGTVTTRLLVADVSAGEVSERARRSAITQLGAGWTATGVLSEEGMSRVVETVAAYLAEAHELGATKLVAVATSASRDATNSADFLNRLGEVGLHPEIISGAREAQLTFLGATYGLEAERVLVVDVGGGSTELVLGSAGRDERGRTRAVVEAARSVDVGSRRVTELFLRSDPPAKREMEAAVAWAADELRPYFGGLKERPRDMIAVAGTATSMAAIELALDPYDPERVHGHRIDGPVLADTLERLASLTLEERRQVVGLEPARAGVIVGGAVILQAVLALAGLSSTLVSERDILYGMVLDAAATEVAEQ